LISSATSDKITIMNGDRTLALFDFDGTVTTKDSFVDFFVFVYGLKKIISLFVLFFPFIFLYFLKLYPGQKLKELFFSRLIKGWTAEKFEREASAYYREKMPSILKDSALEQIRLYKRSGAKLAIVSASAYQWLKPFANDFGMDLIATELEIKDGVFTGKIEGKNCHGQEKVNRILKKYELSDFDTVFAYGDSSGDREMLDLATSGFYRVFK
jgi:phosphatidylglycerophosphatase C